MAEQSELFQYKILLVGDSGVGKTSLMTRFTENKFQFETRSTIGVEYSKKFVEIDGKKIQAQIWDTAGQERFRAMASSYYKGASGALIVYDITKKDSFENIDEVWLKEIRNYAKEDIKVLIIGNKSDLADQRSKKREVVEDYCQQNGFGYLETSAKDNQNVEESFKSIVKAIYDSMKEKIQQNENNRPKVEDIFDINNIVNLTPQVEAKKKKKKCDC